jgi:hypothetical protein
MVTFTANEDLKDGLLIENKALLNVGLQNRRDKIISMDEKSKNLIMT